MLPHNLNPFGIARKPKPIPDPVITLVASVSGAQNSIYYADKGWYRLVARAASGSNGDSAGGAGGRMQYDVYLKERYNILLWSAAAANCGAPSAIKGGNGGVQDGSWPTAGVLGGGGFQGYYGRSGGGGGGAAGNGGSGNYRAGAGGGGAGVIVYKPIGDINVFSKEDGSANFFSRYRYPKPGDVGLNYDGTYPEPGYENIVVGYNAETDEITVRLYIGVETVFKYNPSSEFTKKTAYTNQENWLYLVLASGGGGACGNENSSRSGGASGGAGTNGGKQTQANLAGGTGNFAGVKSKDNKYTAVNGIATAGSYSAGRPGVGNAFDVSTGTPILLSNAYTNSHASTTGGSTVSKLTAQ